MNAPLLPGVILLTRVFLLEREEVDYRAKTKSDSKRKPTLTYEQLEAIAEQQGVGELYRYAFDSSEPLFEGKRTTRSSVSFVSSVYGKRNAILNLIPGESGVDSGLAFQIYSCRVQERFGVSAEALLAALPDQTEDWAYHEAATDRWRGYAGWFSSPADVDRLATCLAQSGHLRHCCEGIRRLSGGSAGHRTRGLARPDALSESLLRDLLLAPTTGVRNHQSKTGLMRSRLSQVAKEAPFQLHQRPSSAR